MKKIKLFSAELNKEVEGSEAELYVNFYLVFSKSYGFTFLVDSPNIAYSNRNPVKAWKQFLMIEQDDYTKYLRRYERLMSERGRL